MASLCGFGKLEDQILLIRSLQGVCELSFLNNGCNGKVKEILGVDSLFHLLKALLLYFFVMGLRRGRKGSQVTCCFVTSLFWVFIPFIFVQLTRIRKGICYRRLVYFLRGWVRIAKVSGLFPATTVLGKCL